MNNLFYSLLLVLFLFDLCHSKSVIESTDKSFREDVLKHNGIAIVEFYAPWCGHCKSLAPEYDKAAKQLASDNSIAKLAKIDATANKEQGEKHGIRGFPTLKFFKNGKVSEYGGGRTSSEIVSWINKKTGSAAKVVNTADELSNLQETTDVVVLGLFADINSAAGKGFMSLADADDDMVYAYTTDDAVKSSLGVTGDHVVLLKSFDDKRNDLAIHSFDADAVASFITSNGTPLVQTFSQEAAKKIFASPIKNHILFFTDATKEHHTTTKDTMTEIAKDNKGKTLFINVPATENRVMDYFGLTNDKLPALILAKMSDDAMQKFPYPNAELTNDGVRSFLNDYFDGKLEPSLKSEDVQPDDQTTDVVTIRGKSFNDIVINNDKDVLVKFYAPWCGHCKKLAPVFDELGARMKNNENVVIAKMDSTANEINVPGVTVRGYPTLYFFKGNDKAHPVKYESGRESDDFVNFLKENAHHPVTHDEL
eukprot:TRINITY_DN63803_c0_g2_i2.p1 TRINITY_DN63803_c0_g2~~TRINITY_DN63803_c0_g2_i2.p1  ORF type:complete len:480 (+),score=28.09 TRINITY_DN63803_c0_g2_i2:60-1499(+)